MYISLCFLPCVVFSFFSLSIRMSGVRMFSLVAWHCIVLLSLLHHNVYTIVHIYLVYQYIYFVYIVVLSPQTYISLVVLVPQTFVRPCTCISLGGRIGTDTGCAGCRRYKKNGWLGVIHILHVKLALPTYHSRRHLISVVHFLFSLSLSYFLFQCLLPFTAALRGSISLS